MERAEAWTVGLVEFAKPWSDDMCGDYIQGFSLGDGTTLVIHYAAGSDKPPTMCRLSNADTVRVRDRHRYKQLDLESINSQPVFPVSMADAVLSQDLFRGLTRLPMPVIQGFKLWMEEVQAMKAQEVRRSGSTAS